MESESESQTMQQFLAKHGITMEFKQTSADPNNDTWSEGTTHYLCTFSFSGGRSPKSFAVTYHQGSAHTRHPAADGVMDCLRSDADCLDCDFEEWADNIGYNTDSRKAERAYQTCVKQTKRLRAFLGAELFAEMLKVEPM